MVFALHWFTLSPKDSHSLHIDSWMNSSWKRATYPSEKKYIVSFWETKLSSPSKISLQKFFSVTNSFEGDRVGHPVCASALHCSMELYRRRLAITLCLPIAPQITSMQQFSTERHSVRRLSPFPIRKKIYRLQRVAESNRHGIQRYREAQSNRSNTKRSGPLNRLW